MIPRKPTRIDLKFEDDYEELKEYQQRKQLEAHRLLARSGAAGGTALGQKLSLMRNDVLKGSDETYMDLSYISPFDPKKQ
mmetsp:Transcript_44565/g.51320  ORF Transcript_44565/g.51320 Transcript_44565/m.51320 type:complete len:80 (+) Transcript_44565:58-297(+)